MPQAIGGQFIDRNGGDDLFQFIGSSGEMKFKVDNAGCVHTPIIYFSDGTTQSTANSTTGTDIDSGTF
jgi:hypothetical protein